MLLRTFVEVMVIVKRSLNCKKEACEILDIQPSASSILKVEVFRSHKRSATNGSRSDRTVSVAEQTFAVMRPDTFVHLIDVESLFTNM